MKTSFAVAALALAASVSAQTTDLDRGTQWCQAFTGGCTQASNSICGANNVPHVYCQSVFTNGKCTEFTTKCSCTTAAGVLMAANTSGLKNTFAATNGACADLPVRQIPDNGTLPTVTGATPTSTGTTPIPTGTTPQKGNAAGKTAASAVLSVAAAVAAVALVL